MERCIQNMSRTIRTKSHVFWYEQLPGHIPVFYEPYPGAMVQEVRMQRRLKLYGRYQHWYPPQEHQETYYDDTRSLQHPSQTRTPPQAIKKCLYATANGLFRCLNLERWCRCGPC